MVVCPWMDGWIVVEPYREYQLILQKIVALEHEMHTLKKLSMSLILRASQLQKCSYSWGVMYCAINKSQSQSASVFNKDRSQVRARSLA